MKKYAVILLAALLAAALICACSRREEAPSADAAHTQEAAAAETPKPVPIETQAACGRGSTTLMIYMIGSDLESKSGAATLDLEEMAASGIDLTCNNVIVYAGGTTFWHNELAPEEGDFLLRLGENGFERTEELESRSMGEAGCLADFLRYCTENLPAEDYALILWDHGNGPVMGFGKDTGHENDRLTLAELRTALELSPFSPENKLAWVGFDACLMSSAEAAVIVADYADYLAASQETEPNFGWNYAFLSELGNQPAEELLGALADDYLEFCLEYYQNKGYSGGDITLSAMDLAKVSALEDAVEGLFSVVSADLSVHFDRIAAMRANTRSVASGPTGSVYDLVDLKSLALLLEDSYPEEASALIAAVEDTVIVNATNAEGLYGLSLYYPFCRKDLYREGWREEYRELGVFPGYLDYLWAYAESWLYEGSPADYAHSAVPERISDTVFTLQLSPEEAEQFAYARYYILKNCGVDKYKLIYSGGNVINDNGLLTAEFDGRVICVNDHFSKPFIPATEQRDTVNGITRYAVPVFLSDVTDYEYDADAAVRYAAECFELSVDEASSAVTIDSLLPSFTGYVPSPVTGEDSLLPGLADWIDLTYYLQNQFIGAEGSQEIVMGGKQEEPELSEWTTFIFQETRPVLAARYENGLLLPIGEWKSGTEMDYVETTIANGFDFEYVSLSDEKYSLIFEICDTHGNRYCSEPLEVENRSAEAAAPHPASESAPVTVTWSEDGQTLFTSNGVTVKGIVTEDVLLRRRLKLAIENDSDRDVNFTTSMLTVNSNTYCCGGDAGSCIAKAHTTQECLYWLDFGAVEEFAIFDEFDSMSFKIDITDCATREKLVYKQELIVEFAPGFFAPETYTRYDDLEPIREASASRQLLYDGNDLFVELIALGGTIHEDFCAVLYIENRCGETLYADIDGAAVNGVYMEAYSPCFILQPGFCGYTRMRIADYEFEEAGITAISEIRLFLAYVRGDSYMRSGMYIQSRPVLNKAYNDAVEELAPIFAETDVPEITAFASLIIDLAYEDIRDISDRYCVNYALETEWLDVALSSRSEDAPRSSVGDVTLFEENGVRIAAYSDPQTGYELEEDKQVWHISIENDTDEAFMISPYYSAVNGRDPDNIVSVGLSCFVGPHQCALDTIRLRSTDCEKYSIVFPANSVSFKLSFLTFDKTAELWRSDTLIILRPPIM